MRLALVLAFAAALIAWTPSAHAEDFTFNVPVRIENMRFAEAGILGCSVSSAGTRMVRSPEVTFPITDGNYRQMVPVTLNLPAGERRDAFTDFSCVLYISFRPSGGALLYGGDYNPVRFVTEYPARTSQAIASHSMFALGTLGH